MRTLNLVTILALAACNSLLAQQGSDYSGQTWLGLLAPATCDKSSGVQSKASNSTRESDLTVSSRTTTPAVDQSGTRGSSTALDPASKPPSGGDAHLGDLLAKGSSGDAAWKAARKQARSLGDQCIVQRDTKQFALILPGGETLAFDDLANQAIEKQLPAWPASGKVKRVLRVSVVGKLQNGKIALTSIRM